MMKFQLATAVCLVFFLLFVGAESGVVNNPEKPATKVLYEPQGDGTAVEGAPGEKKVIVNWCSICVALVEWLDAHIINETENGLFFLFGKVCNALPTSVRAECNDLANQLVPMLTELLLEEFIPVQVCRLLTVCDVSELQNPAVLHGDGVPNMNKLGALRGKEVDLQRIADSVCTALPYKYYALCHEVLKTDTLEKMTSLIKPRK
ncbi:uncharacterized protein LOC119726751 [Patiria miniata]|uniref:Saposin B-type domain-containing protein n=1 Tax=Patiria miniata TaxID=46514 RepID=A0A913ZTK1_PATMI|nr:uncharacterized protein LOC119726751 [Patiria miniata]